MHEQSLVKSLLKQVEEIRRQHQGERVTEVRVELGPLSGVEPLLVASAFQQLTQTSKTLTEARLVIDEVPLLAMCSLCSVEFEVQNYDFRCPACGGSVRVTRGDAFQLVSVSMVEVEVARGDGEEAVRDRSH